MACWVQDKKVTTEKEGKGSSGFLALGEQVSLLPKAVKNAVPDGAANGQHVVRSADRPGQA